jgi:hypothetical protein
MLVTVGDGDASQAGVPKSFRPDASNRQAIDRVWYHHHTVGARVFGYSDRLVSDRVSELGLHSKRRSQEEAAKKEHRLSLKSGGLHGRDERLFDARIHFAVINSKLLSCKSEAKGTMVE